MAVTALPLLVRKNRSLAAVKPVAATVSNMIGKWLSGFVLAVLCKLVSARDFSICKCTV